MPRSRARSYVFTINNYTADDLDSVIALDAKYLCFGFEEGKEGTPHIQGYVQFPNPIEFGTVKNQLVRAHLEVAKGSPKQNEIYCSKEREYYEFGDPVSSGGRLTYEQIDSAMEDQENNMQIVMQYTKVYNQVTQKRLMESKQKIDFYVINPIADAITEIYNYMGFDEEDQVHVITELSELANVLDPQIVIYYVEFPAKLHGLWPRGVPIQYKYGYEMRVIRPHTFIIVTDTPNAYPLYKNIS